MRHFLRAAWCGWKRLAEKIGHLQARLLFVLLYFIVVAPFALALKFFSDPLQIKKKTSATWWRAHPKQTMTLEEAQRQF
jgi:hypothetical protein